ncbi:TPA: ead/Ea22-like family protein [Escherichia coli]|uniref:ead/Ea22-like family protein n=1 Tax=Klebsiella pneumoniae TaxID=573 RepID=UPI0012B04B7B|nr:ead/Ea22-like family protein [Klebsiella pneumoniae]MSE43194.1 ead/Ea22-like family protein [Escherichia coli]MEC4392672.1 ead/Ea22-like family protein [Klebsiella pneumoniae]MEC4407972.1 ead/Ea22-like family protein [Klebsiella pneumoniae]MEC4552971.1 ead/Ea22-like family protein [Klebsiella pneumoniae]HAM4901416.1 ead/Ea22-like family protein [Escherichia coli]
MTDITELAQRMKAAAVRAKTATEEYASGHMSVSVCFAECEEFNRLTDGPDNILALVEALEKAQETIAFQQGEIKALLSSLESSTATAAAADVLAERKRQVTAEGWTPGHDDEYEHGELADAAGCYALSSELFDCAGEPPRPWPWPDEWWKPTNRRRDLVKAGALILAEIERLDRADGIKVEAE